MIDHAALKTELDDDPTARGYTGENAEDAALLNEVQGGISISTTSILMVAVLEAIIPADWVGLNDAQRAALLLYASQDRINPNAANIVDAFSTFFASSGTATALNALRTRPGSRAEELFGENALIVYADIRIARSLP